MIKKNRELRQATRIGDDRIHAVQLDIFNYILDALTFDRRVKKIDAITILKGMKTDLNLRITYVRTCRETGYRFQELPEKYANRKNKNERPDQFFRRVYASHVPRGLTQADIRRTDPAYYNVLHVWHTRHERKLKCLVPSSRARRD